MAQVLLTNKQTGQRVYADPASPNFSSYSANDWAGLTPTPTAPATSTAPATIGTQQILNPQLMGQYQPSQYQRLPSGEVVLNQGVAAIPGTTKPFGGAPAGAPAAPATPVAPAAPAITSPFTVDTSAGLTKLSSDLFGSEYKSPTEFYRAQMALQQQAMDAYNAAIAEQTPIQENINKLEADRAALEAGLSQGITDIHGNPISLESQTGQIRNIQEQAASKAQAINALLTPLTNQLSLAQTKGSSLLQKLGLQRQQTIDWQNIYDKLAQPYLGADKQVKDYVNALATKYFDAGIGLNDSAQTAAEKASKSPSYLAEVAAKTKPIEISPGATLYDPKTGKAIYTAPTTKQLSGGGSVGSTSVGGIKFTQDDIQRLAVAGFTPAESTKIQADINKYGLEKTTSGMTTVQKNTLNSILSGTTTSQAQNATRFLDENSIQTFFSADQLAQAAEAAGKTIKKTGLFGADFLAKDQPDITNYIKDNLMPIIDQYRNAGYTDKEILTMLTK